MNTLIIARAELRRFAGRLLKTTCDDDAAASIEDALATDPYAMP